MDLNITEFFNTADPFNYSASRAELGDNAGPITWHNARHADYHLLDTEQKQEAFRAFALGFGAWDEAELDATDLNALCIQFIAGDMRGAGMDRSEFDWAAYEASDNAGRIYRGDDGQVYFSLED